MFWSWTSLGSIWIHSNILDCFSPSFSILLSHHGSLSLSENAKATGLLLGWPARNPGSLFIEGQESQSECLHRSVFIGKDKFKDKGRVRGRDRRMGKRPNEELQTDADPDRHRLRLLGSGFSCATLNHKLSHTLTSLLKLCQLSK